MVFFGGKKKSRPKKPKTDMSFLGSHELPSSPTVAPSISSQDERRRLGTEKVGMPASEIGDAIMRLAEMEQ